VTDSITTISDIDIARLRADHERDMAEIMDQVFEPSRMKETLARAERSAREVRELGPAKAWELSEQRREERMRKKLAELGIVQPEAKKARKTRVPPTLNPDSVRPDTPLRLDVAARIAYPDGSMTASGLLREIQKGRLDCELTANKQYVTLGGIERMRAKCRVDQKDRASTSANAPAAKPSMSSSTERMSSAQAAAQAIAEGLKKPSPPISPESTSPIGKTVIRLK
jgi:hypothetical protein